MMPGAVWRLASLKYGLNVIGVIAGFALLSGAGVLFEGFDVFKGSFRRGTGERKGAVWGVLGSGAGVWKGQTPGDACMALASRTQSHLLL